MKWVVRFCKKGKLSLSYVEPKELFQKYFKVAYILRFPIELASVHLVFHVSMLKECIDDPKSILTVEGLGVKDNLSYEEVPVQILDRDVKKIRNKEVVFVNAL